MGEWDWVTGNNPRVMLSFLGSQVSERKRRLFACACCHMVHHLIADDRSWHAVELAERYADGLASVGQLDAAANTANDIYLDSQDLVRTRGAQAAYRSAITTTFAEELWQLDLVWRDAALALEGHALETSSGRRPEDTREILEAWAEEWVEAGEPLGWTEPDPAAEMARVLRCIFGNPFRPATLDPAWRTSTAVAIAQGIYDERAFDRLPILADALEDAGCDNNDILNHCRDTGPHARGCWVVDLVLGKA
jgi:hypothetical protein